MSDLEEAYRNVIGLSETVCNLYDAIQKIHTISEDQSLVHDFSKGVLDVYKPLVTSLEEDFKKLEELNK